MGKGRPEEEASKLLNIFLEKIAGSHPVRFKGVCMNDLLIVEDLVDVNVLLYNIDVLDEAMIEELARKLLAISPTLSDYYVTTVIFAMYPLSKLV